MWQDREIRFDVSADELEPRKGEYAIDHMNQVETPRATTESTSCASPTSACVVVVAKARTNLSIGYSSVISINIRQAQSRLRGATHALYVLTRFNVRLLVPALAPVCEGEPVSPRTRDGNARKRTHACARSCTQHAPAWLTGARLPRTAPGFATPTHAALARACAQGSLRVCLHEPREELAAALTTQAVLRAYDTTHLYRNSRRSGSAFARSRVLAREH